MPDKKYYVYIPGSTEPTVLSRGDYDAKKEKLFSTYKDANVVEMQGYDKNEEIGDSDFFINIPGSTQPTQISAADFAAKKDKIYKAYPGVEVSRIRQVDYWGDRLKENYNRKSQLEEELKGIPETERVADPRAIEGGSPLGGQNIMRERRESPERLRRSQIQRELDALGKEREENPAYQRYRQQQIDELDESLSRVDAMKTEAKRRVKGGDDFSLMDEEILNVAKNLYDDARKIAAAPSKYGDDSGISNYWKGVKDNAWDAISFVSLAKALGNVNLLEAVKQIQNNEGDDANILDLVNNHSEQLTYLSDPQKEMMRAFVKKAEVEASRDDLSQGYQAGRSSIQSAGFMLDFILTGGLGEAAANKVAGKLVENTAKGSLKRLGAETLHGLVKAAVMSPLMPSTYSNIIDNMARVNEEGGVDVSGRAVLNAVGDAFIENVSETIGAKPLELLGWGVGKALPTDWLTKTKFGSWGKAMRHSPWFNATKSAGWNGFVEEMFEEVSGNALRVWTGIDKDALRDFMKAENLLTTAASFAPFTFISGIPSTAQYYTASKKMREAGAELEKILQTPSVKGFLSSVQDIESPEELGKNLGNLYKEAVENGIDGAVAMKVLQDYAGAASAYKVMEGIYEEQKDIDRTQRALELEAKYGDNWSYEKDGVRFVHSITGPDGTVYYVKSEDDKGYSVVNESGVSFIDKAQVESGEYIDSGETPYNQYLDSSVQQQKAEVEHARMEQEIQDANAELLQKAVPGTEVNLGTIENPVVGVIQGMQAGRFIVQSATGVNDYSKEEMANIMGISLTPKTDEEIEQEEVKKIEDTERAVRSINTSNINLIGNQLGIPEDANIVRLVKMDDGSMYLYYSQGDDLFGMGISEADLAELEGRVQEATAEPEPEIIDDGTPRDFRGNPLPMRTNKQTGQQVVDGNALWNKDPEAWAKWNDTNPNQKVSSKERLEYTINELNKEIEKDAKAIQKAALRGIEEDEMDKLDSALNEKTNRRNTLISVLNDYNLPVSANQTAAGEQRKAKAEKVKAEQKAGFPGIQQKWAESPKYVGAADEIRLPNGEIVTGNYILTEADAPTASHNPSDSFKRTEGFPVDENGKTVNDRDYEHDNAAQKSVMDKAGSYDQRALQTPVIVSADGVVLSGNDRTMASQIAAANNTDKAYMDYLGKYSQKYGFSKEQVAEFAHPRVVFVPDTEMAYNAANFAKFNAEEKKSQSKTEKAVKAGKTLTPQTLGALATLVDQYDDVNALYNSPEGVDELLNTLLVGEVISPEQVAALKDGSTLSGTGMDLLESTLIGAALDEEAVRIAMSDKSIRKSVVSAISQIIAGNTLEGYTLRTELSDAIALVSNGKKEGLIKVGESVQGYIRQGNLFNGDVVAEATVQMLADAINAKKTSLLKNTLSLYNRDAVESANGQMSILTNDVPTREAILQQILEYLGYGTQIYKPAADAAAEVGGTETETGEAGPVVQSNEGSAVDRDEAYAVLEEGGVGELADYMTDDEVARFLQLMSDFQPYNDALGQAYTDLKAELESKDEKVKKAAQAKIDELEKAQVEAYQPVQDYVLSLLEKYDLADEVGMQSEENFDESEEEKVEVVKKSKNKKEKAEKRESVFSGKHTKEELAKANYTSDEVEQLIYGASLFGEYTSKKTGEKIEIVYADDKMLVYHDHQIRFWIWQKGDEYGDKAEAVATTDFMMRYLKLNGFKLENPSAKKNKYGYWVNKHGVIANPIRIELPSVRKGWAQQNDAEFGQREDGKWVVGYRYHFGEKDGYGGVGSPCSVNTKETFDTKSDAIKFTIKVFEHAVARVKDSKSWESKDVRNLLNTLKTKTLPQALLEEGALNTFPHTEITAYQLDNGVQGDLFGEVEPVGTIAEEQPSKPKKTKKAAKPKAKKVEEGNLLEGVEEVIETGYEDEDEEKEPEIAYEAEEGTPGNYHWPEERICTNPTIITLPGADKLGHVNKVAIAEKNGEWYYDTYVCVDGNKGASWGSPLPSFKSNYIPYKSREKALESAIGYIRFIMAEPGAKQANKFGFTFNEAKELIDYIVKMEIPQGEVAPEVKQASMEDALDNLRKALGTNNPARVTNVLNAYKGSLDEETNEKIDSILAKFRTAGVTKQSKEELVKDAMALYNELTGTEEVETPVQETKPVEKPVEKPVYGANNKIITTDKYEELKARMQEKLGQLNAGFDPEVFFIGAQMAAYHVEAGARKFIDFSKRMINDLGDAIRPYLKAIYNGARDLPGMEEFKKEMDSAAEVEGIDVDSIQIEAPVEEAATDADEATEEAVKTTPAGFKVGEKFEYTIPADGTNYVHTIEVKNIKDGKVYYHVGLVTDDERLAREAEEDATKPIDEFDSEFLEVKIPEYEKQVQFLKEQEAKQGEVEAAEPVVKQVDVNALFGAVNDLARGKREEVKVSDFAEPVQEQTEEEVTTPAEKWASENYSSLSNLSEDEEQTAIGIFNALWNANNDGQRLIHDGGVIESVVDEYNVSRRYVKFMLEHEGNIQFVSADSVYELSYDTALAGGKSHIVARRYEFPAETNEASAETTEETPEANTLGEIGKYTHTKTGKEMTIVRLTGERLSSEEFKQLKARAKKYGGYYSSYGSSKGFLFDNEEDAVKFNTIEQNERTDKQTAADTAAIVSKAASVAIEAETLAEAESIERGKAEELVSKIDEALEEVNDQLALLGYYDADQNSEFDESYGYMKSAEKKAVKDADKLAKRLAKDLGIEVGRKQLAKANIAPAGGDVTFRLPLNEGRELYVDIHVEPTANDSLTLGGKYLAIMYRVENPGASGMERFGSNNNAPYDVSYDDLLKRIRYVAKDFLPEQKDILQVVKEQAEKSRKSPKKEVSSPVEGDNLLGGLFDVLTTEEQGEPVFDTPEEGVVTEVNGFKIGDKVLYTTPNGKVEEAKIYDFEKDGRPVLDAGLAPVLYEVTDWENIKPLENGSERNDGVLADGLQAYNSGQAADTESAAGGNGEEAGQESEPVNAGGKAESELHSEPGRSLRRIPRLSGQNKRNNRVSKGEVVYPKSPAARYRANIEAIKLLKDLQDSGKQATKEQMGVLRQYTGWGGLGTYFNNEYTPEHRELKSLLTDEEMNAAEMSINTAYYTPVGVIDAMWEIAKRLGFEGGNILEGSAGIGNILASMPKNISDQSAITAVELDNITGGILEQLYPDAKVMIKGFEKAEIPNNSIDLAITNVPFGANIQVYDEMEKDLTRKFGGAIHDFCIAKNVRKLSEGGIGIFISTRGTLDNATKSLRQWIVNEGNSDVIGAFRLNNKTFEGTGATSDIIVIRKRVNNKPYSGAISVTDTDITRREDFETDEREWNPKTRAYEFIRGKAVMELNDYFVEHPENMGGVMGFCFEHNDTYRPSGVACWPEEKIDQDKRLNKWVKGFEAIPYEEVTEAPVDENEETKTKEGQLVVNSKGEICASRKGKAVPLGSNAQKVKGYTKAQCLNDYNNLKNAIDEALDYQLKNESDEGLKPLLNNLNKAYDTFVKKYGYLNKNVAISFLRNDVDFAATAAVENYKEEKSIDGKVKAVVKKTGIFNGRVLGMKRVPTPKDAKDGVIVSMNQYGRIDIPFIAKALNKSESEVKEEILSSGLGFENPQTGEVEVEYEYLSGNVRQKLEYAKNHNEENKYSKNIEALEKVIPADIPAHLIEFSLGSDWLPTDLYSMYAQEKFDVNESFVPKNLGGVWTVPERGWYGENNEKNRSAGVRSEKLGMQKYGHELYLSAMNNKPIVFSKTYKDYDGTTHTEHDPSATQAATARMADMRDDFKEWCRAKMLAEPELSAQISKTYNDTFNAFVPKEIRDIFVPERFEGQVLEMGGKPFNLRPHQSKAVIRSTTEPLMLAHEVGSGKTFTLISAAMEMKRLGTAKKPMIVVQNSTLGQFVSSAKALYPNAKVLTISERDRTAEGRSAFYAKIKYNDWDIIIVPQSVFDMMPDSEERKRAFIQEKIEEKKFIIEQAKMAKNEGAVRQLKQELEDLEYERDFGEPRPKKNSKKQAEALNNAKVKVQKQLDRRTDEVSDFDDMGIDALLVDEAHAYKHLGFSTSMQRGVKGVDPKGSKRAAGVYLKTRSVFDKVGWKNVVFATGTPISNTAAEIWTFMKYLMTPDAMRENHIYYFDDFVRNFGNITQNLEFTTSGKFKETTRFSSYTNLPELVRIWWQTTDVVLTKDAVAATDAEGNVKKLEDELPKMEDWKDDKGEHKNSAKDIYLPQSPSLVDIMTAIRKKLEWYEGLSGKEKKEYNYIPLKMFGLAKMAAIDPRLVDRNAADEPNSKTNQVVAEVLKALEDSKKYKGTAALFSDNFRRWDEENGKRYEGFNLFEEIKRKLVEAGVPEDQIVIMKSGMTTQAKEKIFQRVNDGDIRVIMGTTDTLGTGVNIQERLFFVSHIDAPNRPMDYTQRNGRILRQGNLHKDWNIPVRVVRFGVEDSLDVTAYQRLSTKAKFINSVMDGKPLLADGMDNRVLEEEEEGEFDNPVAVLSGSEYAMLKSNAERELRKLRNRKEQHRQDQIYIEKTLKENANRITYDKKLIEEDKAYLDKVHNEYPDGKVKQIVIDGSKSADINTLIKDKLITPLRKQVEDRRYQRGFTNETLEYIFKFDAIPTTVNVKIMREEVYDDRKQEWRPEMRTLLTYTCKQLGFEDRLVPGGYSAVKDVVTDFVTNFATGKIYEQAISSLESNIARKESDNALMLERRGKPFADEEKLQKQEELVKDYTEKMKAEMAAKEAKYKELANVSTNFNLDAVEVNEEDEEEHESIVTDETSRLDVSDPLVMAGAVSAVNRLAKKLNLKVKFDDTLESKGAYSEKNGIRINLANCESVDDAIETLLHEGVAHFGLRQLLGKDGMSEFVDYLLENATNNIKQRIEEIAQEQGKSMEYAAEEYVAELAEKTDYTRSERSLWRKILDFIRNVFDTITGRQNRISDDTIRELLIASYENLQNTPESDQQAGEPDEVEHYRLRTKPAPEKTGIGYKVFFKKGDKLYPPMVANPNGEATPVGVWLDADAAPIVETTKTGRPKVKQGGKGTQGGSGTLAYRPGWHLGEIPYALQFNRLNPKTGKKDLFPKDFVWAEVEYAADKDYQKEADAEGISKNGKFQHSLAGLKSVPEDGFYRYRTNPNPETDPWIITGAMKVNRVLDKSEVDKIVTDAGREPQEVEPMTDRETAADILFRYDEQDGERYPWMYASDVIREIEEKLPYEADTEFLFGLIDRYNRLDAEDFEEGRRDFSGAEKEETFEDILAELRAYAKNVPGRNRPAWHGSGADFEAFDLSHLGEGEGAQAHGYGHYVSLDKSTAGGYANRLYRPDDIALGLRNTLGEIIGKSNDYVKAYADARMGKYDDALKEFREEKDRLGKLYTEAQNRYNDAISKYNQADFATPDDYAYAMSKDPELNRLANESGDAYRAWDIAERTYEGNRQSLRGTLESEAKTTDEYKEINKDAKRLLNLRRLAELPVRPKNLSLDYSEDEVFSALDAANLIEMTGYERAKDSVREFYEDAGERQKAAADYLLNTTEDDWTFTRNLYSVDIPDDNGENYIDEQEDLTKSQRDKIVEALKSIPEDKWKWDGGIFGEPSAKQLAENMMEVDFNGKVLYTTLSHGFGSAKKASKFLSDLGFVGIKYDGFVDGECAVIFKDNDIKIVNHDRFRPAGVEGFISNAEHAVKEIRMEKATPEQWKNMLVGKGLKAAEDKWIGLTDWLDNLDQKTISKKEVLDYIKENRIQIEEEHYMDANNLPMGGDKEWDSIVKKHFGKEVFDAFRFYPGDGGTASEFVDEDVAADVYRKLQKEYGFDHIISTPGDGEYYSGLDLIAMKKIANRIAEYGDNKVNEKYGKTILDTRIGYTTDGLNNKREVALTIPTIESWKKDDDIHFGDAGEGRAIAWVRFGDTSLSNEYEQAKADAEAASKANFGYLRELREKYGVEKNSELKDKMTDEEREKSRELFDDWNTKAGATAYPQNFSSDSRVLFIDEIQSKRHQEAREKGYIDKSQYRARRNEVTNNKGWDVFKGDKFLGFVSDIIAPTENDALREAENYDVKRGVPAAPFEKNWHELAMKRMLRLAAEEGYDYVAWTTGEQQAERYNIGGVLNSIYIFAIREDGSRALEVEAAGDEHFSFDVDADGTITDQDGPFYENVRGKKLSEVFGKGLSNKIMEAGEEETIEGEGLRVGGEGMKGFYDDILPRFMNKYGKKWGVSVEDIELPQLNDETGHPLVVHAVKVTPEMKESVMQGQLMFRSGKVAVQSPVSYSESMGAKRLAANKTADQCGIKIGFRPSGEMMFNGKPLAGRWVNGKMYICLDHCRDNDDVVRTVLHEGVGHNGLRKLVGDENMDAFCIAVFNKLPKSVREEIADNAVHKYGLNIAEAVEEYLAEKAEVMEYERSFWDIVRDALRNLLAKIGINVPLNGHDVKWILWQSYNANKQSDILNEAKRQVIANRLGFTLRQQADKGEAIRLARNREADMSAARIYNKDVMNWMSRLHETWVDKDDAVNRLVNAIEKSSGRKAKAFEDIRLSLNQQSSKGLAAMEKFEREHFDKMTAAVKSIMDETGATLHEVERYVMIKHALERNDVFAKRDAINDYQTEHDTKVSMIKDSDKIDDLTKQQLIAKEDAKFERHKRAVEAGTDATYLKYRNQDYGGLTAMYSEFDPIEPFNQGVESNEEYQARVLNARHPKFTYIDADGIERVDMQATEKAAKEEVKDFESKADVDNLWKEINGATKFTLKHQYDANMLSRDQYNKVKDMFKYYVPLRGFAENTAEDMYDYYNSDQRRTFTPPLMIAKGRKSEAESPFGYIGSMASSAIAADMKNESKLALYYFVSNRADNDLVGISEVWFKNTGIDEESGKRIFTPVYPPFKEDLSREEAKKAYEEWEKNMEEEAKAGFAFKGRKKLNLHNSVIHIDDNQQTSHVIKFKVGGKDMMMYINGNPRAAQAINNELNVEMSTDYQKVFGKVLRWFSGINTSYNPEFWLSNAQRDALFAIMSVDAKENPEYAKAFRRNFGKILRNTLTPGAKGGAYSLKKRLDSGNLGDGLDELYKEFVENGGVTGYTTLKNNEEWELEIRNHTGKERAALSAIKHLFEKIQGFGEAIEQMTRFAAYITSRQEGKEIKDSVNDAKELTVNFNRKGSGKAISFKEADRLRTKDGKPLTLAQKALVVGASWLPVYGRRFIIFFNASVQGLNALYKLFKKNPSRMGTWVAGYVTLGVINAVLHALLDDDDDYLDIPDYERRNNLLVGGDGVYFKWALPQEARVFYAMGDMAVNHIMGRTPNKGVLGEVLSAASDIAPLNPAGGVSAIAPSALAPVVEVVMNRDYKGSKIYNDMKYLSDEERKRTPAYKQAYQGTGKLYTLASEGLNWLTGGDYADAGWVNINPAVVEHLLQGATGGAGTTIGKMYRGTFGQIFGEDFAVRNTPFLSRLLTITDDRYRNAHTTELFDFYKAEAEHTKKLLRQYSKNGDDKKLDKLIDSDDYEIMMVYESYRGLMEYYNDELRVTDDKKERKELMREQDVLRKEMIKEISEIK